jgi:hypothetical protein
MDCRKPSIFSKFEINSTITTDLILCREDKDFTTIHVFQKQDRIDTEEGWQNLLVNECN